ncbi:DUF502 domain-containing protein [candidate division KSB1 bacterium]
MKKIYKHFKNFIIRGLLALVPIVLSFFAIRFLYVFLDTWFSKYFDELIGFTIPGLGLIVLVILLYLIGLIASNIVGKKFFRLIEKISNKIPLVRMTYQVGKQVSSSFSIPDKQVFQRAVLVEYLKEGQWVVGFVTGSIIDHQNEDKELLKVFVPSPPVPTSGYMILVSEEQIRDPGWTIEEALKAVISGGIIGPDEIRKLS